MVTRRSVLSIVHSIFYLFGFTCLNSINPKILLQESWEKKMSWGDKLSDDFKDRINKFCEAKIPLQLAISESKSSWSLQTFCDASRLAYAATEVNVQLVAAKFRVAPLKNPETGITCMRDAARGTFVANRLKEIRSFTYSGSWFHVAGVDNLQLTSRSEAVCITTDFFVMVGGPQWLRREALALPVLFQQTMTKWTGRGGSVLLHY
ncbi:hypothetical protein PR048_010682 [Dryococelus australis]|uniref:Uncharacterized protein n=1 Tax=Dryococelus australis TaxID=614101 RepID=A0ABQ9I3E8_9NEOP|nr:hypothetical protein PR048_010682 [Dryococelus australis]